jgi:transposase
MAAVAAELTARFFGERPLLLGCAAGFVNVPRIKGSHNAILSGMLAAEEAAKAIAEGRANDELIKVEESWRAGAIGKDLHRVRNVKPLWSKFGTIAGVMLATCEAGDHVVAPRSMYAESARLLRERPLEAGLDPDFQEVSDEEWEAIAPLLWGSGCGFRGPLRDRPDAQTMRDPRARLDAIFRGATLKWQGQKGAYRAPWRALPAQFGKADTVSRTHRRWAHAKLWLRLLQAAFGPQADPALAGLRHWICCAFRRAIGVMGLAAVTFARRLGAHSALPAPPHWLADEALYGPWQRLMQGIAAALAAGRPWQPPPGIGGEADLPLLWDRVIGRRPLPRWAEPV